MRIINAPVAAVVLALAASGCSGASSPGSNALTGGPSSPPSPTGSAVVTTRPTPQATGLPLPSGLATVTSSPSASPTASAALGRCHTSQLRGAFANFPNGAAGNDRFDVRLMNVSSRPCTVQGYPGLGFLGRQGQAEHVPVHRGSGMLSQDPGPHLLLVRPHASVSASVGYTPNCSKPDASDGNVPASIQITPPDERDHVTAAVDQRIQICGHGVTVTALVAGSGGVRAPGGGHT